jgi:Gpi18-like mannosyltransferase
MFTRIVKYFLVWRVSLFFVAFASLYFLPTFGARFPYYDTVLDITKLPNWIWGFGNFDGVHYLRIAQDGYSALFSQSFFPVYPYLIKFLNILPKDPTLDVRTFVDPSYFYTGLILSNMFFIGFLYMFYKLLRLDYSDKIVNLSLLLVLAFPTSFYFGSIYTESLFLFLAVASIYFFRTKRYILAGVFAAISCGTRVIGILIPIIFLIELLLNRKKMNVGEMLTQAVSLILAPLGLFVYMFYLNRNFGDGLLFLNSQPGFGAERSAQAHILLPQVFYRYLKIFMTVKIGSITFFNAALEFISTIFPLTFLFVFFKKIRPSYFWFSLLVIILPTLTGTLSSMPRYILAAFPIFPLVAIVAEKNYRFLIAGMIVVQALLLSMFIRGYWVG